MNPARAPRERRSDARLLVLDAGAGRHADLVAADLPSLLRPRDLLVVNDAATLPASLHGRTAGGAEVELRLLGAAALPGRTGEGAVAPGAGADSEDFWAVLFGAGDWRTPTEHRPPPPRLERGDVIQLEERGARGEPGRAELLATIEERAAVSPRLVRVRFGLRGAALWSALYRLGRPVQYAYLREPLSLWSVQTAYAARPWAAWSTPSTTASPRPRSTAAAAAPRCATAARPMSAAPRHWSKAAARASRCMPTASGAPPTTCACLGSRGRWPAAAASWRTPS